MRKPASRPASLSSCQSTRYLALSRNARPRCFTVSYYTTKRCNAPHHLRTTCTRCSYAAILKDGLLPGRPAVLPDEACGTLQYMAPELFVAGRPVDASIDIYAFGELGRMTDCAGFEAC